MAHYDYRCNLCGYEWELNVPIADRDKALGEPCPDCKTPDEGSGEPTPSIERIQAAPGVSYTYSGSRPKTPDSFKDVLRNIKSKHRHSTIDV